MNDDDKARAELASIPGGQDILRWRADFWQRCISLGVGVVPFRAYLDYDALGNYDETKYAGIRYVCLLLDTGVAVLKAHQFVIGVDFSVHDLRWVADTPEGALDAYERRLAESRGKA